MPQWSVSRSRSRRHEIPRCSSSRTTNSAVVLLPEPGKPSTKIILFRACRLVSPKNEPSQPVIVQHESSPEQNAEYDGKQDGKRSLLGTNLRRHGPAQIACQQDRAENRGRRNQVEDCAGQQHHPKRQNHRLGVSKRHGYLDNHLWFHHFITPSTSRNSAGKALMIRPTKNLSLKAG